MRTILIIVIVVPFVLMLIGAVVDRIPATPPGPANESQYGSYVADLTFEVDQHYHGWNLSGHARPNLRGFAYADDLGPQLRAGLQLCSTSYHHSRCEWHPRLRFTEHTRNIRVVILNQIDALMPAITFGPESITDVHIVMRDAPVNVTIPVDGSLFDLHAFDSHGPFTRGGSFRYDADPSTLHLPH